MSEVPGKQPSAVTAMIAVVLAALMGVFFVVSTIMDVADVTVLAGIGASLTVMLVQLLHDAMCGAVCRWGPRYWDRANLWGIVVTIGAALVVLRLLVSAVISLVQGPGMSVLLGTLVVCLVPVFTVVAALRPATRTWLNRSPIR